MKEGKIKGGVSPKINLKPIKLPPAPMPREEYEALLDEVKKSKGIKICPICNTKSFIKVPRSRIIKTFFFSCDVHIANTFQWVCHNPDCRYKKKTETELTQMGTYMKLPFWRRLFSITIHRSMEQGIRNAKNAAKGII